MVFYLLPQQLCNDNYHTVGITPNVIHKFSCRKADAAVQYRMGQLTGQIQIILLCFYVVSGKTKTPHKKSVRQHSSPELLGCRTGCSGHDSPSKQGYPPKRVSLDTVCGWALSVQTSCQSVRRHLLACCIYPSISR